ncbi:type VI secretion system protein [Paraburkholderia fungorum]|uniref:Type VI secretion protein IcmF n=1 Tax=Paraburkholderia fungorum TaxID=134537 RepID=A0A420GNJ3_9BURK|nr:type VI secretion system protein [Paraburkholderia fungorum]RKF46716.1 type VI secretion protein IcmF [Paraburkholderia fungorum]
MLTSDLFLLSLAVLIVVVCTVLGVVVYFAAHGAQNKTTGDRKIVRMRTDSLRNAFRQAVELVEGNIASRAERYNVPWILVLNEGDDPRPLPIAQSGVASVLSSEAATPAATQGIAWQFFDRGIVIDIKAAYLGSPDEDTDEKPWDEFLSLCRNYRPQRPFDSVVVTVPAAMLLAEDTDARLELVRHAKLAHRRLWLAQNRFAMRFALYVVVTGGEALAGFTSFARALPEPLRASMLGWSSPYDLSVTYQASWVDTAMTSIERAVSDASAELFTLDTGHLDAREILFLPARIDALRSQLQLYVDELLRPSAYHEPFFFRGIYLTGDTGELSGAGVDENGLGDVDAMEAGSDPYGRGAEPYLTGGDDRGAGETGPDHADQAAAHPAPGERARPRETGSLVNDLMLQPAFLRDLFDKKIFLEYGLTRPSRTQHLARPLVNRTLHWGTLMLLGGWGIGLAVATVQLSHRHAAIVAALDDLRKDAQERASAEHGGQQLPADWYRSKALALIGVNDRLHAGTDWSFFMPGSWNVVDDLNERVRQRFEREFGEIVVTALEREMLERVGTLTGIARDPGTGQLIVGDDCAAPAVASAAARGVDSLAVEDAPAMRALQRYVGAVDQLDAALQAMQRLQRPSAANADALRLAVRYAFGAELQGNVAGSLPYFYRDPDRSDAYAVDGVGGINLPIVQQALRCTFDKGAQQLDEAIFAGNPLLNSERAVVSHLGNLSVTETNEAVFAQLTGDYRAIAAAIGTQQDLLASGKGGWIRQTQFVPGPVYDRTFARAAQSRLLGPDSVARVRSRSGNAYLAFRSELALRFGGADAGIVWIDKDARYAVSPARLALRDGLLKLLNQPFMVVPRDLPLPSIPEGSTVTWDRAQLDQALALGEVRKHFLAEGLNALPDTLRPVVEQALDVQFARLIMDQVAAAAAVSPAQGEPDGAAFDAARSRLVKIRAALADMDAAAQAADLDALTSRDAMEHLRLVDDALMRAELYATRSAGTVPGGAPAPVLAAFGIADPAQLGVYLDQQAARAAALGKQAAVYLSALGTADAVSPLAQRWQAIELDLGRYQLKNPNSSLLMLEQFVQTLAGDARGGDCIGRFPSRPSLSGASDYFTSVHMRLYDSLLARCGQSYNAELHQQWDAFASTFNQNVAGHQPFGVPVRLASRGGAGGVGSAQGVPADFAELGQTLRQYERASKILQQARNGAVERAVGGSATVRQFADRFDPVAALLAPLYPANDGAPTGYDLRVDFRANRTAEIAANQVIDWTLRVGAQSVSMNDTPGTLHWEYGMPVTLVLRFAKDSPLTAVNDPGQRAFSTDGRALTWQFADPWALFSFISQQRVADVLARDRASAQLLKFDFPLSTVSAADLALLPKLARGQVFVRLTLSSPGSKTPLAWPGSFPTSAPEWNAL